MKKNVFQAVAIFAVCIIAGGMIYLQREKNLLQIKTSIKTQQSTEINEPVWNAPPDYIPLVAIETIEKFGSYYVWFYEDNPIHTIRIVSLKVTKEQLVKLGLLRHIVMSKLPLNLFGDIKKIFESEKILGITIDATSGACAARAFISNRNSNETICMQPITMASLYIILVYRRDPMVNFYAKGSLFEDIKKEREVQI